ncbi:MAG: hypothetical protein JRI97_07590 [Deltaproteobacteria bacterium]|nr:hypothetical protein [Deltaproteobacteria bacterium]
MDAPSLRRDLEHARAATSQDPEKRSRGAAGLYSLYGNTVRAFLSRRMDPDAGNPEAAERGFWEHLLQSRALESYDGAVPLCAFLLAEAESFLRDNRLGKKARKAAEDPAALEIIYGGAKPESSPEAAAGTRALSLLSQTHPADAALVREHFLGRTPEAGDERLSRALDKFSILYSRCLAQQGGGHGESP